ncbi:hypothetical protein R0137_13450 [Congregibacter brevis]|uniref:Lipocalin-like domain-containing protein n=1 Tax=Congregibacter brevis TaxID=3081201 RepID=A0ABZ0ICE7_9GAMM|nr:hypothetical protein R0137_13450 [Congregibacter sp. IMCC45268]
MAEVQASNDSCASRLYGNWNIDTERFALWLSAESREKVLQARGGDVFMRLTATERTVQFAEFFVQTGWRDMGPFEYEVVSEQDEECLLRIDAEENGEVQIAIRFDDAGLCIVGDEARQLHDCYLRD